MKYDNLTCKDLRALCYERGIKKGISELKKVDLIFTLSCDDILHLQMPVYEPGCSWERAIELDPFLVQVKSKENLQYRLQALSLMTLKNIRFEIPKHKNKVSFLDNIFLEKPFTTIKPKTETIEEKKKEVFTIDTDKQYDILEVNEIDLEYLIELGLKYTEEFSQKFAFDYQRLHDLVPDLMELNSYIGWECVKSQIVQVIIPFILHLNDEKDFYHTVIQGPPGVGKTTLAKILSTIYSKCGLIHPNNSVIPFKIFKRSDLIGEFLGQTALKTQKAIDSCIGGVMFIDEAYTLGLGEGGNANSYSQECIDTINQNLTERAGEFICIIAGYKDLLNQNFFSKNYGLKRRFPISFTIEKYNSEQLMKIFLKKVENENYNINVSKKELFEFFRKNSEKFKYYAGDIEVFFSFVKRHHAIYIFGKNPSSRKHLIMKNIEEGFQQFMNNRLQQSTEEDSYSKTYLSMYN